MRSRLRLFVAVISIALAPLGVGAQTTEFCAKPWASLSNPEKEAIDNITKNLINEIGPQTAVVKLWDTRTIPYYVDSGLSATLVSRIRQAAANLSERTLVKLVKCNLNVAQEEAVKGFVYIGKFADFCKVEKDKKKEAAACSKGLGMRDKVTLSGLGNKNENAVLSEKAVADRGAQIGLKEANTEFDILHELIHRLGFAHQQQNPFADRFFSKMDNENEQCAAKTAHYKHVYWIPYYDPASIMHYPLPVCKMELDCTVIPAKGAQPAQLKTCKIDQVVKDRSPCFYAKSTVTGDQCFKRPVLMLGGDGKYSPNDFGQSRCLSMLDQALILSRYFAIKRDTYDVAELATRGVCETP